MRKIITLVLVTLISDAILSQTYEYRSFNLEPGTANVIPVQPVFSGLQPSPQINLTLSYTNTDSSYTDLYKNSFVAILARSSSVYDYNSPGYTTQMVDVRPIRSQAITNTIGFGLRHKCIQHKKFSLNTDFIPTVNWEEAKSVALFDVWVTVTDANNVQHNEVRTIGVKNRNAYLSLINIIKMEYHFNKQFSFFTGLQSVYRPFKSISNHYLPELNNFSKFYFNPMLGLRVNLFSKIKKGGRSRPE